MSQDVHISSQTLVIPSHITSRVYIHHNINIIESGVKLILTHSLLLFRACQNCPILTELKVSLHLHNLLPRPPDRMDMLSVTLQMMNTGK